MTDRQEVDVHSLEETVAADKGTDVEVKANFEHAQTREDRDVQSQKKRALIQLLRSWRNGDEQEQRSTWEYLKQALDEDRLSDRKLFP